ncbi:AMP-binding enzyme domain protein [Coleofasciculus chthonoplastes PCC 7420]|uniref:AMP-binding enzyme domain protein n=2 Tax=Coleofasciculaceae TaxID=1892251 RepID=B4VZJ3_9CYAN|nr:AMP-binding enzyme domain protein [Coleofasciculus chthonoplastes PCC 7420]
MYCQGDSLVDILKARSRQQPEQRAYTFLGNGTTETAHLTYKELDQQAQTLATYLQTLAQPGDRALLIYPAGLEFVTAFIACLYAGVVAVPIHPPRPNRPLNRLQAITQDAQALVALTTTSLLSKLKDKVNPILELQQLNWITTDTPVPEPGTWSPPTISPDTLAFLQYTSGSTGIPKGVMVSHANLIHNLKTIQAAFELTPESVSVSWLPHYHDMGLVDGILEPLYTGCLGVLMPPTAFLQNPGCWLEAISHYRATHSGGPNLGYELCANKITPEQQKGLDLSCWLSAYNGAEPIRAETLAQFTSKFSACGFQSKFFYPCYGMAESTLMISGGNLQDEPTVLTVDAQALEQNKVVQALANSENVKNLVGCGHPWLETKVLIVNPETLTPCAENQVGEIWVSSSSVAQGYWQQVEVTEETFGASVPETTPGQFLRTGDLGFWHDGELFITGRIKDVIIIWGRNHYPQDIEYTVSQSHPALRPDAGAAVSIQVNGLEKLVITQEVERSYLRKLNVDEVVGAIRKVVAADYDLDVYAVALLKTASIPKTSSGKIQRRTCRDRFLQQTLDVVGEWQQANLSPTSIPMPDITSSTLTPETLENWLISRLATVLNIDPEEIDPEESFAQYGLDSSVALEITGELEVLLERELEPTLFWEYTNIESLTEYLSTEISD